MNEDFLSRKLDERRKENAYRQLKLPDDKIDFCSNDYLGIVKNDLLGIPQQENDAGKSYKTGSTGSRLLSGNYALIEQTEQQIARFHDTAAALIYNSGFDANLGLLSCVPQRGDTILYDHLSHASLRDGIRLSAAASFSFKHNDLADLEKKLKTAAGNIFLVTESVFSMDGDKAPLQAMADICEQYDARLIVDEAHATGVVGEKGEGLIQMLGLQNSCFARIHTFGKACGTHGAAVVGSELLRNYLVNFSRPFIYSTALPEASIATIKASYETFPAMIKEREQLAKLISMFHSSAIPFQVLESDTPVQVVIIPGNSEVKNVALKLQDIHLDVRAILYPSVAKGAERLRIVLHSFNTADEVSQLVHGLT